MKTKLTEVQKRCRELMRTNKSYAKYFRELSKNLGGAKLRMRR